MVGVRDQIKINFDLHISLPGYCSKPIRAVNLQIFMGRTL